MKEVQQAIEIGKERDVIGEDGSIVTNVDVIGVIPRKTGEYQISPEVGVKVCPAVNKFRQPSVQKVIYIEGDRRKVAKLPPSTGRLVTRDISSQERVVFKVIRGNRLDEYK